jgi:hydrogenase maturation protein HypF
VKGLGGFQLACDAANDEAVRRLRARKKRSDKPFALMASGIEAAEKICTVCDTDRQLLLGHERPIEVLPVRAEAKLSSAIAPGNNTVGIMLPYTPLHAQLFGAPDAPPEIELLVMTSGNISDEPIVTSNEEAWRRLSEVADYFLFHNRDIYMRVDDSVARSFRGKPRLLRRSRAYAPQPIDLGRSVTELLACGGELKNTFCLTKGQYAILSQHIGDVENYETLEFFRETLANLKKLFRVEPKAVAHDLHPLYLTTRLAEELDLPRIGVQHHHAHIASCMAQNHLSGPVIGVAFDGTGYGTDGKIWGGEFLIADYGAFERRAHLRYVELPGGDAAVRQPWRSALSWLESAFPGEAIPEHLPIFSQTDIRERQLVTQMIRRRFNTVSTSSCGRLFDAVASLVGLRHEVTFEGQAAIELETVAEEGIEESYPFEISGDTPAQIDMRPMIAATVKDVAHKTNVGAISARFHNTVAEVIAEVCRRIRQNDGLKRVCLSGGTFQNVYLLERAVSRLESAGFEVFLHSKVPANDGGIALGQAVIANEIINRGA